MKQKGRYPKRLPARLILVKKQSAQDHNGWKPKARGVCCGNFEEGTVGGDWKIELKYQEAWNLEHY
eukprot:9606805-Prorocentrum_lima.AAC.1